VAAQRKQAEMHFYAERRMQRELELRKKQLAVEMAGARADMLNRSMARAALQQEADEMSELVQQAELNAVKSVWQQGTAQTQSTQAETSTATQLIPSSNLSSAIGPSLLHSQPRVGASVPRPSRLREVTDETASVASFRGLGQGVHSSMKSKLASHAASPVAHSPHPSSPVHAGGSSPASSPVASRHDSPASASEAAGGSAAPVAPSCPLGMSDVLGFEAPAAAQLVASPPKQSVAFSPRQAGGDTAHVQAATPAPAATQVPDLGPVQFSSFGRQRNQSAAAAASPPAAATTAAGGSRSNQAPVYSSVTLQLDDEFLEDV